MDGGAIRCVRLFGDICGVDFLQNTALITTMWDKYPEEVQAYKETERELLSQYWFDHLAVHCDESALVVNVVMGSCPEVVTLHPNIGKMNNIKGAMYARSNNEKETFQNIVRQIIRQTHGIMPELQKELDGGRLLAETIAGRRLKEALDEKQAQMDKMKRRSNVPNQKEGEDPATHRNVTNEVRRGQSNSSYSGTHQPIVYGKDSGEKHSKRV